ncbi:hypothetical protein C8R44DRAFT_882218 [Mycena epipterygia]|nr:hypothetical protein C8R44DRAFT_882218 [Mycena epipterygia]
MAPDGQDAPLHSKLIVLPGLLISTAVTVTLMIQSRHDSTSLYTYVSQELTQVQVMIQVASHLLGFFHIFTLSTITNFSARLRLRQSTVSLLELRLWQSVSSIKFVWNLPFLHLGVLVSYLVLHLLPASLWAGALTPVTSWSVVHGSLRIPSYSPDPTNQFWNHSFYSLQLPVTHNDKGSFSYTPAALLAGQVLNAASTAVSIQGVQISPKNDNSRLYYSGRSYGVGSSAGIENIVLEGDEPSQAMWYSYQEIGYVTDIQCHKNHSSGWAIQLWSKSQDPAFANPYLACGVLPNSPYDLKFQLGWEMPGLLPGFFPAYYATYGFDNDSQIVALVGVSNHPRNMFGIAAGTGPYNVLNNIQCDVNFTPHNFEVAVNISSSLITGIGFGVIPQSMLRQVTYLSMLNNNLYDSVLGNVFLSNIENVATVHNASTNNTSVILEGISTSLESMIDNLLVGVASAQLEIAGSQVQNTAARNATTSAATSVTVPAMRLGKFQYVVAITTLNFLIVVVFLGECLRTRGWKGMPLFDYNDIASVVVAASKGGRELGDAVVVAHKADGTTWSGDPGEMAGGKTRMTLQSHDGMPVIEAADVDDVIDMEEGLLHRKKRTVF